MSYRNCIILLFTLLVSSQAYAKYDVDYQVRDDFQLVQFRGEIMPFDSRKPLKDVLSKITGEKDIVLKVDRSLGGWVPAFNRFIRGLKTECSKLRGSDCRLIGVFTSSCASACTDIPLLTDYAVSLPGASFGFHREWLVGEKITIESKKGMVRRYIKIGGNREWFEQNIELLSSQQVGGYWLSKKQELESGLIDLQLGSLQEFFEKIQFILNEKMSQD